MKRYQTINANLDNESYPIIIGDGVISDIVSVIENRTQCKKVMLVSDSFFKDIIFNKVETLFINSGYDVYAYYMDSGKLNKNINEILKIYRLLEENDFPRDATLIAIGGGVIGDLVGFIASTWLRGMNLVHIPTSLMAMLDSSIGGKVAINFRDTINAIGNYYHPIVNIIDLSFLDTLHDRDFKSGLAEVIKCAIISDLNFFKFLESNSKKILNRDKDLVVYLIAKAINIKLQHVSGDVREGGKRLLLNYGHTLGHSIEISTEKNHEEFYRHGEGVSIGIMAAAYIAQVHLTVPENILESIRKLLKLYELPVRINLSEFGGTHQKLLAKCVRNVKKDKKRKDNNLRLILCNQIGEARVYNDVPNNIIENAFSYIID